MLQEVLTNLDISVFSQIALLIFFVVFLGIIVWVVRRPRGQIDRWANLPLDPSESHPTNTNAPNPTGRIGVTPHE
ncbi:MAG: cbb3-type cytochrome oxidase subunit 3 [Planctomycetota bacterium]